MTDQPNPLRRITDQNWLSVQLLYKNANDSNTQLNDRLFKFNFGALGAVGLLVSTLYSSFNFMSSIWIIISACFFAAGLVLSLYQTGRSSVISTCAAATIQAVCVQSELDMAGINQSEESLETLNKIKANTEIDIKKEISIMKLACYFISFGLGSLMNSIIYLRFITPIGLNSYYLYSMIGIVISVTLSKVLGKEVSKLISLIITRLKSLMQNQPLLNSKVDLKP